MNSTLAPGQSANIGFTAVGQPAPPVFLEAEKPSWEVPLALTVTDPGRWRATSARRPGVRTDTVARLGNARQYPMETASTDGAAAGKDFIGAVGSATFAPGQTRATVTVEVTGDKTPELNEALKLVLSEPIGAIPTRWEARADPRRREPFAR